MFCRIDRRDGQSSLVFDTDKSDSNIPCLYWKHVTINKVSGLAFVTLSTSLFSSMLYGNSF
ncbi:unnamed protein product [Arabidopsis halleri]